MPPCSVSVFANKGTNAAPQPRCCFPTGLLSPSPGRDLKPCCRGQMPVVGAGGSSSSPPSPACSRGALPRELCSYHSPLGAGEVPPFLCSHQQPPGGGLRAGGKVLVTAEACGRTPSTAHTPTAAGSDTAAKKKRLKKSRGLMLHDADGMRHLPPAPTAVPMAPAPALGTPRGASEGLGGSAPRC